MPNGVKQIDNGAFAYCDKLETIYIPKSVEVMGSRIAEARYGALVYCEAQSQPSGWADDWNVKYDSRLSVIWGYEQ